MRVLKYKKGDIFMIINKLNLLLAERFIKASKLAKDTGIAQSTISKIVNNVLTIHHQFR